MPYARVAAAAMPIVAAVKKVLDESRIAPSDLEILHARTRL
jgi:hypothetical protein